MIAYCVGQMLRTVETRWLGYAAPTGRRVSACVGTDVAAKRSLLIPNEQTDTA